MRKNMRYQRAEARLKEFYLKNRRMALAAAYALALDEDRAFEAIEAAFYRAGKRLGGRKQPDATRMEKYLLQDVRRAALAGGKKHAAGEVRIDALRLKEEKRDDMQFLRSMEPDRRLEWAVAAEHAVRTPDAGDEDQRAFAARIDAALVAREIWSTLAFRLERRFGLEFAGKAAGIAIVCALLAVVVGLEAGTARRVLGYPDFEEPDYLYADVSGEDYWRKNLLRESKAVGVSNSLYAEICDLPDDALVRVDFAFYDPEVMRSVQTDGQTLEELYINMYKLGAERGRADLLSSRAVLKYFENYVIPFQPDKREEDFVSYYKDLFGSLQACIAEMDPVYAEIAAAYPEVFGSAEAFEGYLCSEEFADVAYPLAELAALDVQVRQSPDDADLRLRYETAIFAFYNDNGSYRGQFTPDSFRYSAEELYEFYQKQYVLSLELKEALAAACTELLPDCDLRGADLADTRMGVYSATLTKARILELGADGRFEFYGVSSAVIDGWPENVEPALSAALADGGLLKKWDIYTLDDTYIRYSINYQLSRTLPDGFISDLRAQVPCENTQFETKVGYAYEVKYAHPASMTGYGLLRDCSEATDVGFVLRENKMYTVLPNT